MDIDPIELSLQLKKPTGEAGKEVAKALNVSNKGLYELAFEFMNLQKDNRVLEIGFGNGLHFPEYFKLQPRLSITGVDFSRDMCEEAKTNNEDLITSKKLSLYCKDTTALPFSENQFDLVVALNVIYFLDPPEVHLTEIQRVLRPGGLFLIGYRPRHTVEHLAFTKQNFILYETDELTALLEKHNFEKVRAETKSYQKMAMDDTLLNITDSCLLVKKV